MVCLLVLTQISLSAQSYKLPDYTTFKLANGLYRFLMEQHDVPVISVSALIPAGAINDKDKSGLASLTATALKHGTKISQKQS
jgi:predicted Zn-dependent peptidase